MYGEAKESPTSRSTTPTGILRQKSFVASTQPLSGSGSVLARIRNAAPNPIMGSPALRGGVHFAVPANLCDLLTRAAAKKENNEIDRQVCWCKY